MFMGNEKPVVMGELNIQFHQGGQCTADIQNDNITNLTCHDLPYHGQVQEGGSDILFSTDS